MAIIKQHLDEVCKLGHGTETCSFLMLGSDGFECAKGTGIEPIILTRREAGTMNAMGDNCQGWHLTKEGHEQLA